MSSKYDKRIEMSREEEGSYHRREIEHTTPPATKNYTTYSTQVVPVRTTTTASRSRHTSDDDDDDNDNYEEWTTSKRKVNHKTRQVETRVSRQLLVEDGKVIADSGPQVTTRIKEDNKVEECEKEKAPKNKGKFEAIENAPESGEAHGRVLGEKKEIQRVSREVREENMQYHDERFKELTGHDVHRRAIQAPHELITINDHKGAAESRPRGKMVHYSNKGKKYRDTDEILEVAKLAIDGSITKEVKRTKHHEECSEDEKPDETGEAEALRQAPIVQRSSRQHADIVHDFNDTSTPIGSSDDEQADHRHHHQPGSKHHHEKPLYGGSSKPRSRENEAFPRYEIDPLLNSLKDEDFRPAGGASRHHSGDRYREHALVRKESSDDEQEYVRSSSRHLQQHQANRQRSPSPYQTSAPVEIPEEYRTNRHKLLTSKGRPSSGGHRRQERERSFSPTSKSHLSHASHRSAKSHRSHKEDASVQAHLTDEEQERKSLAGSSGSSLHSHEKATRHLQRQSTRNSTRNYYFGEPKRQNRPASIKSSSSSSSLSDAKERTRKSGRDSGFKSPHSMRTPTPISATGGGQQQIYSVSSKSKKNRGEHERAGTVSPTPTSGSVGQRSVKTTTTTLAAGLTDRPRSRQSELARTLVADDLEDNYERRPKRASSTREVSGSKGTKRDERASKGTNSILIAGGRRQDERHLRSRKSTEHYVESGEDRKSFDSVSLSSLGPNATTIKVPYKQVIEHETKTANLSKPKEEYPTKLKVQMSNGKRRYNNNQDDMQLHENIENLRKRLDNINDETPNKYSTITKKRANDVNLSDGDAEHFDYKTIVATVQPSSQLLPRQQVVNAYNVRMIEHSSPFLDQRESSKSVNDLTESINRLESLSSELSTKIVLNGQPQGEVAANTNQPTLDDNNEANFNISDYIKYGEQNRQTTRIEAMDDAISLVSSCSLQSARTYDVRALDEPTIMNFQQVAVDDELNDEKHFPVETVDLDGEQVSGTNKRAAAWIFDPNDGSTTAIIAPPQPKKPEPPKVETKTEDLAQSRGGRSYYLELFEADKREAAKQNKRPSSIDSLYSRWNSHSTLSNTNTSSNNTQFDRHLTTPINKTPPAFAASSTNITRKSRQRLPASVLDMSNLKRPISSMGNSHTDNRPSLPFGGPPLSNRSRSSSCLASSTRPTKYSIYGGLKRTNDGNKPVPRLSYSRAIGPKSQRQIDAQPKTPSRYLKMK